MTHLLSKISIINFKSIITESFELSAFTPLVGYNNAGKSNLLEAIKWLLRKSSLPDTAFYDKTRAVEMEGKISGISETILDQLPGNQRASIEPFLFTDSLYLKRIQAQPSMPVGQIRLLVKDPANVGGATEWRANPTGLDQALQALFPEPIQIGAMENSEEDVSKSKNTTTIGKLLSEIIGPIQASYSTQVQTALDGIKDLLDADGTSRATELNDFDTAVNSKVQSFFPGVNIKVHVPTPELKEVFSKGTIKVFENLNPDGRDVAALGHGAQRSIQMALVRHLADIKRESGEQASNTILLIDEPELYLHPQAIEVLRDALKTLSTQGYQVIFSTHSPFMITSKDVGNTLLIRKNDTQGTYKRNSLKATIPTVATTAPSQLELIFSLSHSSNILFSERVILAEGTTENRLLPSIIHKVTSRTIGLHKIALVSMGGSGNTRKAMLVLNTMDIPTKAIVDLDFALKQGEKDGFLTAGDTDVASIQAHLASIAPAHSIILNAGWPTNSSMSAADAFRLLAREAAIQTNLVSLKAKMQAAGIYVWTKGTIEDHLGGIPKNETGWANFNARLESEELDSILPNDHTEITDLVTWLIT
ncbi:AAA family ATPase [uncultured Imperialibacter sp.]|uniref:ATP-dependent nuclease n=1 Tax=uncultured Imperialibacter sp. TaxID=1672639 RepID=UPI0030DB5C47|tara:strand:+ start:490 stop:2262 length:1773 start_codon:yes stop_codon:yes gene_type:complete